MPLGNGGHHTECLDHEGRRLAILHRKMDGVDDNARSLKVGKPRVHFEPNPIVMGPRPSDKELKLSEGCIEITTGHPSVLL